MATVAKHTPSPWRTERDLQGDYRIVYNETGNWLAKVYSDGESEVAKADARLIAAAPDLLAVCELFTKAAHDARNALNSHGLACPASIALAAEKARAAIAKTDGGVA
jgi:hypothetical protein